MYSNMMPIGKQLAHRTTLDFTGMTVSMDNGSDDMGTATGGSLTTQVGKSVSSTGESTQVELRTTGQVEQGDAEMPEEFRGKDIVLGYSFSHREPIFRPFAGTYARGGRTGLKYRRYGSISRQASAEELAAFEAMGGKDKYPGVYQ